MGLHRLPGAEIRYYERIVGEIIQRIKRTET
jgi:hypothetical protein